MIPYDTCFSAFSILWDLETAIAYVSEYLLTKITKKTVVCDEIYDEHIFVNKYFAEKGVVEY